jgi:hypothetical protein
MTGHGRADLTTPKTVLPDLMPAKGWGKTAEVQAGGPAGVGQGQIENTLGFARAGPVVFYPDSPILRPFPLRPGGKTLAFALPREHRGS